MALCSLNHVINLEWMKEAYRLARKDGAPGIDGVTTTTSTFSAWRMYGDGRAEEKTW